VFNCVTDKPLWVHNRGFDGLHRCFAKRRATRSACAGASQPRSTGADSPSLPVACRLKSSQSRATLSRKRQRPGPACSAMPRLPRSAMARAEMPNELAEFGGADRRFAFHRNVPRALYRCSSKLVEMSSIAIARHQYGAPTNRTQLLGGQSDRARRNPRSRDQCVGSRALYQRARRRTQRDVCGRGEPHYANRQSTRRLASNVRRYDQLRVCDRTKTHLQPYCLITLNRNCCCPARNFTRPTRRSVCSARTKGLSSLEAGE
jgi:hypothetical protein